MIAEFAIIPDVFECASYPSPELAEVYLERLLDACRTDAIVRDLFDGRWSSYFKQNFERWHPATKEIIETFAKEGRLRSSPQILPNFPEENADWCHEAFASKKSPLDMIVAADAKKLGYEDDPSITLVAKIHKTVWWQNRSPSVAVLRHTDDYLKTLRPVLKRANAFMFIDPHIDEREPNYAEFCHIFRDIKQQTSAYVPRIEIHFSQKNDLSRSEWEKRVQKTSEALKKSKLKAEVFVWPVNFHDRYLVTDIIGISLPYGFDIDTKGLNGETIWTKLGRKDREKIELNFEPNTGRYGEVRRFQIGHNTL
jgi:hypothetical protein